MAETLAEEKGVKIGLELHCQLTALKTKLFCSCSADYRGKEPNTLVCPVCLGLPGSLPVLNRRAIELAIMAALALNCKISKEVFFFRKNYFYPDLPKDFQISQYDRAGGVPLATDGHIDIVVNHIGKRIRIRRVHLEEDPGRITYVGPIEVSPYALVDYNRSGVALLEIVTEPDITSPKEARVFLQRLRSILEHLGVSDGSLEGAMRCDANISIAGGPRIEVKNISSFKEVERALSFEIIRLRDLVSRRVKVKRETRHWDEARRITFSMRVKEEEHDYRYFPEPDLLPIIINEEIIERARAAMPELPDARKERFIHEYSLPDYDAEVLTSDKALADFFEECAKLYPDAKKVSNWLMGDFLRYVYEAGLDTSAVKTTPEQLVDMIKLIDAGTISGKIAKEVLKDMIETGRDPEGIVVERGLLRISDAKRIREFVKEVFASYPKAVKDALKDEKAVHFLIGQVMKITQGRADPQITNRVVREELQLLKAKRN